MLACNIIFYIEGNGKEGKIHEDLVLSKMAETFVIQMCIRDRFISFNMISSVTALFNKVNRSAFSNDFKTYTWQRESNGRMTSNEMCIRDRQ